MRQRIVQWERVAERERMRQRIVQWQCFTERKRMRQRVAERVCERDDKLDASGYDGSCVSVYLCVHERVGVVIAVAECELVWELQRERVGIAERISLCHDELQRVSYDGCSVAVELRVRQRVSIGVAVV